MSRSNLSRADIKKKETKIILERKNFLKDIKSKFIKYDSDTDWVQFEWDHFFNNLIIGIIIPPLFL